MLNQPMSLAAAVLYVHVAPEVHARLLHVEVGGGLVGFVVPVTQSFACATFPLSVRVASPLAMYPLKKEGFSVRFER